MAGFNYRYLAAGEGAATIQALVSGVTALKAGDLVSLDGSNQLKVMATNDTKGVGVVLGPGDLSTSLSALSAGTSKVKCVVDENAVYGVTDANARKKGDRLDVAGATGAMTVAAVTNGDFVVVADSTAAQETLVRFAKGSHLDHQA